MLTRMKQISSVRRVEPTGARRKIDDFPTDRSAP